MRTTKRNAQTGTTAWGFQATPEVPSEHDRLQTPPDQPKTAQECVWGALGGLHSARRQPKVPEPPPDHQHHHLYALSPGWLKRRPGRVGLHLAMLRVKEVEAAPLSAGLRSD